MAIKLPQMTNLRALRSEIHVDKSINSRKSVTGEKHEAAITKLSQSIKEQGLIHLPLLLRMSQAGDGYKGRKEAYLLIAGFRRQEAMDKLEIGESDYRLAPSDWDLPRALAANLVENLQREDLTTYEVAQQCHQLATVHNMGATEIASQVKSLNAADSEGERQNLSKSHVENMIRLVKNLHPTIQKAWKEGHAKASLKTLLRIVANKSSEGQLNDWKGATEAGEKKPGEKTKGNKNAVKRPSVALIGIALARVKENDTKDAEWKKGAIAALSWAAGMKDSLPGIKLDAPSKEEADDEEDEEDENEEGDEGNE